MPLAILTIRKELHGFLFLCIRVVPFSIIMGLRLAALGAAGAPLLMVATGHSIAEGGKTGPQESVVTLASGVITESKWLLDKAFA